MQSTLSPNSPVNSLGSGFGSASISPQIRLTVRQQPKHSRMCGFGEKVDRRPIDPPPIIEMSVLDPATDSQQLSQHQLLLSSPFFFMYATLCTETSDEEVHVLKDLSVNTRAMTGSIVSSLYRLKDCQNGNREAGFFVFPDLSVRMEGRFRLKFTLFEIVQDQVVYRQSCFSDVFTVYAAKRFPGMEESTALSKSFAEQGLKIRIRKELRQKKRGQSSHADGTDMTQSNEPKTELKVDTTAASRSKSIDTVVSPPKRLKVPQVESTDGQYEQDDSSSYTSPTQLQATPQYTGPSASHLNTEVHSRLSTLVEQATLQRELSQKSNHQRNDGQ